MGTRTIYTCDRCGHEQNNDKQMWRVGAYVSTHVPAGGNYFPPASTHKHALWCRHCVETYSLLNVPVQAPDKTHVIVPAPTLEEIIRDIVRTAMQEE